MTDFRVTPQALDAAAEAIYKRDYEPLSGGVQTEWQTNHCRNLARTALAAAAPLLCQPLQDEIDRLRAQIEAVEKLADEWSGGGAEQGRQHIMSCSAHPCPRCLLAEAAMDLRVAVGAHTHEWVKMPNVKVNVCIQCGVTVALAAVPVGTGGEE